MPRVVLDPNVLVSALISPTGTSARLLVALRDGWFEAVTSPLLLAELAGVLKRPKFARNVSPDEVDAYVEFVRRATIVIEDPSPAKQQLSADPGDEYLLALARVSLSPIVVSGDHHLLDLAPVIDVRSPRAFLESLDA